MLCLSLLIAWFEPCLGGVEAQDLGWDRSGAGWAGTQSTGELFHQEWCESEQEQLRRGQEFSCPRVCSAAWSEESRRK